MPHQGDQYIQMWVEQITQKRQCKAVHGDLYHH